MNDNKVLPAAYRQIKSLHCDGQQVINTNLYASSSISAIYFDIEFDSCNHYELGGASNTSFTYPNWCNPWTNPSTNEVHLACGAVNKTTNFLYSSGMRYKWKYGYNMSKSAMYMYNDDNLIFSYAATNPMVNLKIYFLNINRPTMDYEKGFVGKIYNLAFYRDSLTTKTLDLYPCYRKKDHKLGFYCIITNNFYINAGNGDFTY